ncbi:ATP-binding protein [Halarchaeum sp. CBA1220]|uniref:sensor histidine kinase n=1 Tax=Halarchaeum sp. CBA1220 TaxID=1853682 RepID=UPI0021070F79|nr:ATP-binding protein [Halarchaeum sp. CBA1220]
MAARGARHMVNTLLAGHVAAFALAAIACVLGAWRALDIEHDGTRTGLVAFFLASGGWAATTVGFLLVPVVPVQRALVVLGLLCGLATVGAWLYFAAAYTGRSPGALPYSRLTVGVLVAVGVFKATNPLHHAYFGVEAVTEPFPHLAVHYGIGHWLSLGLAYVLAFVGVYMILEHFHLAGADTRPLAVLVGFTALPVLLNIVALDTPWLLPLLYEPLGVAAFAIGVGFVYFERFETIHLAADIDDPVVFLDRDGYIRDYNQEAAALFGELDGAAGERLADVLPTLAAGIEDGASVVALERGGETRYYDVTTNPFMAGETRTGESIVVSDATERERYRRRLEARGEQLEALNRVVRHDIRNDMAVVTGWSGVLEDHVDEDGRDALRRIRRTAEHTIEITENVRDFVDALADEGEMSTHRIDLHAHLDAELERVREAYPNARFETPTGLPDVAVEANELLSSVFRNLLNNAVQHSDVDDPVVTVTASVAPDTATVRVADNGPGVPDAEKERVFGKDAKGVESTGTGIGLYLVRTLLAQFGGSVHVEDNDPRGAVFVVELPRASEGARAEEDAGDDGDERGGVRDAVAESPPD